MAHFYRRQPPRGAKVAGASPLGRRITAHFLFNGDFQSAVRGKSGRPVVTAGPTIKSGPGGKYAQGNGSGKIVTDLLPSDLGCAGATPRTVIAEFTLGDTSESKCLLSFGDASGRVRSQFTVEIGAGYRGVRLSTYSNDINFEAWTVPGSSARVFLAITYDGNVTITFRSWARVDGTGQILLKTQTSTLAGPLDTGNTTPLNLMGGGTYNFPSMDTSLSHVSVYGGRCLSPAEIDRLYADRHQVMAVLPRFPYAALAAAGPAADTALAGAATTVASASGSLSTAIRLAGSSTATATASGTLNTTIRLAGAAQAQASATGTLSTAIRLAGLAQAGVVGTGTLTTAIKLTGAASAVAAAVGALAGGGAGLSGAATAAASGAGTLITGIPLTGAAYARASAVGALTTGIALAGAAAASSTAAGMLVETGPSAEIIDVSKISAARIVVFESSGSRVVPFEGSGSRVVPFEGSGSRVVVFEGSGERVRIDGMDVNAKAPTKIGDKWTVDRDPDEKSHYLADITQELIDRATTAVSVELVLVGVVQLELPTIQTATKDNAQRTYAVAFLGGTDAEPPEGWKWVARVTCANGERFDKTTWFNKVDP